VQEFVVRGATLGLIRILIILTVLTIPTR